MSAENPYAPPTKDVEHRNPQDSELASLWKRFFGGLIDGLIAIAYAFPLMSALGIWDMTKLGMEPPFTSMLLLSVLGFIIFSIVHGYFLHTSGQTIGKKLMGTQIVDLSNQVPPLGRLLLLRYLPLSLVSLVPLIGNFMGLVDGVFAFRSDRRCIHDHIAGTKVINYVKP